MRRTFWSCHEIRQRRILGYCADQPTGYDEMKCPKYVYPHLASRLDDRNNGMCLASDHRVTQPRG